MISVAVRMISPAPQPGQFTRDMAKLTVGEVLQTAELPETATQLLVRLQLVRLTGESLPLQELLLEASSSPIGTTRWAMQCPGCHTRRRSLYLVGPSLFCRSCCGLKYTTHTLSSPRRRGELFRQQRATLEARTGRRSRRWGWLVLQERQEALRLLGQALRTASH